MLGKSKPCVICGSTLHTKTFCWQTAKKRIKKESPKTYKKRTGTRKQWFRENPPDDYGNWVCYLQISRYCLKQVDRSVIQLDHVKPKSVHHSLRYETDNLAPSCPPCNKLKDIKELPELALSYPHLKKYL